MPPGNRRNKVYTVLILCIGIVISVWLFQRKPENIPVALKNTDIVSVSSYKDINLFANQKANDDW